MRIYLQLSPNTEIVPFNYQLNLVGAFHRWLGENELHDDISLYSLSWLRHLGHPKYKTNRANTGLEFPYGAELFISSPLPDLHKKSVSGIFENQHIQWGMKVQEVRMRPTPVFGNRHRFLAQSPIFIQRSIDGNKQFFFYDNPESGNLMTETLQRKLRKMTLPEDVAVTFDTSYAKPYKKLTTYRNINIQGSMCPVIVEGHPRAVQAAWEMGVGNSTGIGFGALNHTLEKI